MKRACYASDKERITGVIDRLPTITYNFAKWDVASSAKEIKKAASDRGIDGVEKQELIKELTRFDAENTCPICLKSFGCGREVSVMLCLHEFHKDCLLRSALAEYECTGSMPRCGLCRESLRGRRV